MNMNFDYMQPVKIHFGKGKITMLKVIKDYQGQGLLICDHIFTKWQSQSNHADVSQLSYVYSGSLT